ncbi:hypothetical protein Noda2021_05610 [Candidatus Dependentiae bacterium Noda2021]|nr:hypothetical protein Noda2021_05610 [Candidatus Dependentiae bacterium Noda2021]
MKNLLLITILLNSATHADEKGPQVFKAVCHLINTANTTVRIVATRLFPGPMKEYLRDRRESQIKLLIAEDKLLDCLALNIKDQSKKAINIPEQCSDCFNFFVSEGGHKKIDSIMKDFKEAFAHIPAEKINRMSKTKIVLVTGAVGVTLLVVFVVATPIALPGTAIAAKASALGASAHATVTGAAVSAKTFVVTQGSHVISQSTAVGKAVVNSVALLSTADKIILAGEIAQPINEYLQKHYLSSNGQKLSVDKLDQIEKALLEKGSIKDRVIKIYS